MLRKCMDLIMAFMLTLGCLAFFVMMLLTATDVIMRYFFNSPISASYELSEILMGIMSPIALLYCGYNDEHVSVDILFSHFSPRMKFWTLAFSNIIALVTTALLAWQSWYLIMELKEFGLTSPMLKIPLWPMAGCFLMAFAFCIPVIMVNMSKGKQA